MNIKRKRVLVLVNTWSRIVKDNIKSREQAIEILKKCYEELGVEPIRGTTSSPDLYDKDMASLYVIGKWGLGIDRDVDKDILQSLFHIEIFIENIIDKIKNVSSYEEFCGQELELCKTIDDRLVARILRYIFTLYYFGFIDRNMFIELMRKIYIVLKPMEDTVKRFTKFVIAYEVGKKIIENDIKNKLDINMIKNTIALDIGIPNTLPSVGYIVDVAKYFFEFPQNLANSLKSENK